MLIKFKQLLIVLLKKLLLKLQFEQNTDFQKTLPQPGSSDFNYFVNNAFQTTGPGGATYQAIPPNRVTGEPGYWTVSYDRGQSFSTLAGQNIGNAATVAQTIGLNNQQLDRLTSVGIDTAQATKLVGQGSDAVEQAFQAQQTAQREQQNAAIQARNAELAAAGRPTYNYEGEGLSDFDKFVLVAAIAAVAAPYVSSFFQGLGPAGNAAMGDAAAGAACMQFDESHAQSAARGSVAVF
jgi:hypothetical protein